MYLPAVSAVTPVKVIEPSCMLTYPVPETPLAWTIIASEDTVADSASYWVAKAVVARVAARIMAVFLLNIRTP